MPSKRTCFSTHACLIQTNSAGEFSLLRFWVWVSFFFFEDARSETQHSTWPGCCCCCCCCCLPRECHCDTALRASPSNRGGEMIEICPWSSSISWLDRAHREQQIGTRSHDLRRSVTANLPPGFSCKLQRRKPTQGKTWDMGRSYQLKALLEKHARIRSLRSAFFTSNQIPLAGGLSPVCF